jgi:hypothetical protein
LILSGCSLSHPQTAEEFRLAVPGARMAKVDTFEVDRSFKKVAETFKKRAPKCLNKRITTTSRTNTSYQVITTKYNPTVVMSKDRVELHLQQFHEQGVMYITEVPEGGYFLLVADAYPIGKNKTRVDIYRPSFGYKNIITAIKGWASGKTKGCPDLTK